MATDTTDIQLEQYKMLRGEVIALIEDTRKLEVQVISLLGALYVWLATHPAVPKELWYIGVPVSIIAGVRALTLYARMGMIARYMRRIEEDWFGESEAQPLPGWERYFLKNNRVPLSPIAVVVWLALVLTSFFAPEYLRPPQ